MGKPIRQKGSPLVLSVALLFMCHEKYLLTHSLKNKHVKITCNDRWNLLKNIAFLRRPKNVRRPFCDGFQRFWVSLHNKIINLYCKYISWHVCLTWPLVYLVATWSAAHLQADLWDRKLIGIYEVPCCLRTASDIPIKLMTAHYG